jgi:hypothetical protein
METTVQAVLASVDGTPLGKVRPCDIHNLRNSLELRKVCGLDSIPNECHRHLSRRPLVHMTNLLNHCLRLYHFPSPWKEAKVITLPKPGKDQTFPQNLLPISLSSTAVKLLEKVILKIVERHNEESGLLNASKFGFHARHNATLQCMKLTYQVTLNFNSNMSTTPVFLDTEKAFDTTWHTGFLYELSRLQFSISLIKLLAFSFLGDNSDIQSKVKCVTPRDIQAGVPQDSVLSPHCTVIYK